MSTSGARALPDFFDFVIDNWETVFPGQAPIRMDTKSALRNALKLLWSDDRVAMCKAYAVHVTAQLQAVHEQDIAQVNDYWSPKFDAVVAEKDEQQVNWQTALDSLAIAIGPELMVTHPPGVTLVDVHLGIDRLKQQAAIDELRQSLENQQKHRTNIDAELSKLRSQLADEWQRESVLEMTKRARIALQPPDSSRDPMMVDVDTLKEREAQERKESK